jgi:HEAT repeat protein
LIFDFRLPIRCRELPANWQSKIKNRKFDEVSGSFGLFPSCGPYLHQGLSGHDSRSPTNASDTPGLRRSFVRPTCSGKGNFMQSLSKPRFRMGLSSLGSQVARALVLLFPTALLLTVSVRVPGEPRPVLWLGTAFQLLVCSLSFLSRRGRRQPLGPSVITLYLIALGWLWWGAGDLTDWFGYLSRAILLVVPMVVFAFQTLTESGAPVLRRARLLAQRLASRKDWPADLASCRTLPEVKAFREALRLDATPALALLKHKRPEVRVAALAALEFRKEWRAGQAEYVLWVAENANEPAVRAAAVSALANLDERSLVEMLANFLRDPSWEVRRATTEALLWDTEQRWPWIRHAVRRTLADPILQNDGPLRYDGNLLTVEAVTDLTSWATEKGGLATRAALTLGAHYSRALSERPDEAMLQHLQRQLADPHAPAVLRMELARLLWNSHGLDRPLLERLLDPANPAPLRLTAVEALLGESRDTIGPVEAMAALRDLARLPNREIALATADLVQRRLGVDLGLPTGQPLPPVQSPASPGRALSGGSPGACGQEIAEQSLGVGLVLPQAIHFPHLHSPRLGTGGQVPVIWGNGQGCDAFCLILK